MNKELGRVKEKEVVRYPRYLAGIFSHGLKETPSPCRRILGPHSKLFPAERKLDILY
jgi:hypothetical protein